jgi:cyclophilin family peptidyl-prolyl cis-trans isomerase
MQKNSTIIAIIIILVFGIGLWLVMKSSKEQGNAPITSVDTQKVMNTATLSTNMGDITIEFFAAQAPNTVANFMKLAGAHFYDGVKFHRVIKGFMIQGGDPLSKDDSKMDLWGTGGPGYSFADEIDPHSDLYKAGYLKGIVAMANSGPNTNGSQFFIMTADYPLPPQYTIFGKVTSGQDVVDKIALVATAPGDRPVDPVIIKTITLK